MPRSGGSSCRIPPTAYQFGGQLAMPTRTGCRSRPDVDICGPTGKVERSQQLGRRREFLQHVRGVLIDDADVFNDKLCE